MPSSRFLPHSALQKLFDVLAGRGYAVMAPQVRNGCIVYEETTRAADLPWGISIEQAAGFSRMGKGSAGRCFAWANGPQALKPFLFAPSEPLWRIQRGASVSSRMQLFRRPPTTRKSMRPVHCRPATRSSQCSLPG